MTLDEILAKNGDVACMQNLVNKNMMEGNFSESFRWASKLAELGDSTAMYILGQHFAMGAGVARDFCKAAEWMRKSAEAGDEDAVAMVENYEQIIDAAEKAKQGDAQAQGILSEKMMKQGTSKVYGAGDNYKEALYWAHKAAEQNDARGCCVLGLAYEHGRDVEENCTEAIKWYQRATELGSAMAASNLARFYGMGMGVPQDEKHAFELVKLGAECGEPTAKVNLGMCYARGSGCETDLHKAVRWLKSGNRIMKDAQLTQIIQMLETQKLSELPVMKKREEKANMEPIAGEDFRVEGGKLLRYTGTETDVTTPSMLTEIDDCAFELNDTLKSVKIVPNVRVIGCGAFTGCHKLKKVILPDTLEVIQGFAFTNCYKLAEITLPDSVKEIGESAFINCSGLREIVIPAGVKVIREGTFANCRKLKKVVLSEGLERIEFEAFADCPALEEVTIPTSVKHIDDDVCAGYNQLKL